MATQKFLDQNGLSTLWTKIKGLTAPYALTAARATYAASAGYAQSALTASRATTAGFSTTASNATYAASAGSSTTASRATYAASAGYVAKAADSEKLDGLDSTAFATAGHTHTLPQESIYWSTGNTNSDVTPIEMAMSSIHSANRLMFANPAGISAEYSTDGGSTWKDYGLSNEQKISLVSGLGTSISIGKKSSGITVNDKFRITINATNCSLYTACKRILLNVTTNGAGGANVKLEYSNKGSETTFKHYGTYNIGGWSGWNAIPFIAAFGGGATQTGNAAVIRLTFGITSVSTSYSSNLSLLDLQLHGTTYWGYPSGMAKTNHLYSWDTAQNAAFPADVYATNFRGTLVGVASQATTAGYATTASRATYAASAGYAGSAGSSTTASNATYAASAGSSTTAGYAVTATRATYAASAGSAGSSTTASYAVNADKLDGLQATAFATAGHNHSGTYATPNDVSSAISALVDSAPDTLNTLNELAAALGDDKNFATTMTNALANKADKNGSNASGTWNITATTASYAVNSDKLDGLQATAFATAGHTHIYLTTASATKPSEALSDQKLSHYLISSTVSGAPGYAGDNTGFPVSNNANGILWLGNHSGNYGGQLGISSDTNLYYRFITSGSVPTNANGGSWGKLFNSKNSSVSGGGSSWGSSITVNLGGVTATLTIPSNPNTDSKVYNTTTTSTYYLCGSTSNGASTGTLVKRTDVYVNGSGALYAVKFHESSDETLKDFKEDIDVNLDELAKLPKKYFTWKEDENGELCIGTSAQELQKLYPELVDTNVDGTLTVDYNKLSIIALAAIDKLNDKNKELEERLEKVEKILSKLNIE